MGKIGDQLGKEKLIVINSIGWGKENLNGSDGEGSNIRKNNIYFVWLNRENGLKVMWRKAK